MASPTDVAQSAVARYAVDAAKSRFLVKAAAAGLLSSFGHNPTIAVRRFTGEAVFNPQAPEQSSLHLEIEAASLEVSNDVNTKDRQQIDSTMKEDVLESSRFPTIRYAGAGTQAVKIADGLYRITLAGKLSLHGVERELSFPCNVTVSDDNLRANGEFLIRQTDYAIKLVSVAGGALKLKDELKFTFDIAAHRVAEAANA